LNRTILLKLACWLFEILLILLILSKKFFSSLAFLRESSVSPCLCGSFCFLFLASGAQAQLRAGVAKVNITPDVQAMQVPLGGYTARKAVPATGVHDPVYARALVLSNGETKVGIVSVDLCFLPADIRAEVLKRVQASGMPGWDAAHLFLAATHSHTAPDPLAMHRGNTFSMKGWPRFDARLLTFTADRIAEAIVTADKRQTSARMGSAVTPAKGWNRNRRGETTTDPDLTLLKITHDDGRPLAVVVVFAAHPTLYDDKMLAISADWPGAMEQEVEKSWNSGEAVCLFLNGAEGDASPDGMAGQTPEEKIADYGANLAKIVTRLLKVADAKSDVPLAAWTQPVNLPPRKPNALFLLAAAQFGASVQQAKQLVNGLMPEQTQLSFVRVGDLLLMGFPCEPTGELGLEAKAAARKAGFGTPAVVALVNDWLAYALTPEQYRAGKYEAGMSFYGDQLGPILLVALEAGLHAPVRMAAAP
jgi:hypothetical protein